MSEVTVYGADWCQMTTRVRAHLKHLGVEHDYINIDHDRTAAEWVAAQNDGKEKKPTLDIAGKVLCTPSNDEVDTALHAAGIV